MRYVGVDVSKRRCRAAFVDGDGEVVDEFSFSNDFDGIEGFVSQLSLGDRVVMDSTGVRVHRLMGRFKGGMARRIAMSRSTLL